MKLTSRLQVLTSALAASAIVSTPASAGLLGDIIGIIFGGGGNGGGGRAAPEIDASAGIAAMALVACVAAIAHRRNRR